VVMCFTDSHVERSPPTRRGCALRLVLPGTSTCQLNGGISRFFLLNELTNA
jgi:hypothetical protein